MVGVGVELAVVEEEAGSLLDGLGVSEDDDDVRDEAGVEDGAATGWHTFL